MIVQQSISLRSVASMYVCPYIFMCVCVYPSACVCATACTLHNNISELNGRQRHCMYTEFSIVFSQHEIGHVQATTAMISVQSLFILLKFRFRQLLSEQTHTHTHAHHFFFELLLLFTSFCFVLFYFSFSYYFLSFTTSLCVLQL